MTNYEKIVCPSCGAHFNHQDQNAWTCSQCAYVVPLVNGVPVFSDPPKTLNPSEKIERSPVQGSVWRQFNWKFIASTSQSLPDNAAVLDVGAGRGDFKALFTRHAYLGLDIYPYPEIDLAADLIRVNPLRKNSFDLIVLANVIEHVYEYRVLVQRCAGLLKPGGILLITVPFLLKLHQEPVDFHRYTRYALQELAAENQLEVITLDAYYNPVGLLDAGLDDTLNLVRKQGVLKRFIGQTGILFIQMIINFLKRTLGNGQVNPAASTDNPNVLGYQCIFRKPTESS